MSQRSDEIRNKYIQNPPEGMTADDIRHMSEDDVYLSCPLTCGHFSYLAIPKLELSYKGTKSLRDGLPRLWSSFLFLNNKICNGNYYQYLIL